jgi:hypothetical protein
MKKQLIMAISVPNGIKLKQNIKKGTVLIWHCSRSLKTILHLMLG